MPLHVVFDHQCAACEAEYIPYDQDVPCPQCGTLEAKRFDFIAAAAKSLRFNKSKDGTFLPPAWWSTSLGDNVLGMLFPLFESADVDRPNNFDAYAITWMDAQDWGHRLYLKEHVLAMARRLNAELRGDPSARALLAQ